MRKHTPAHDFWHPRVEGQIRDAMHAHPEWFASLGSRALKNAINGIAKRIVGEIVAVRAGLPHNANDMAANCIVREHKNGAVKVLSDDSGVALLTTPLSDAEQP